MKPYAKQASGIILDTFALFPNASALIPAFLNPHLQYCKCSLTWRPCVQSCPLLVYLQSCQQNCLWADHGTLCLYTFSDSHTPLGQNSPLEKVALLLLLPHLLPSLENSRSTQYSGLHSSTPLFFFFFFKSLSLHPIFSTQKIVFLSCTCRVPSVF